MQKEILIIKNISREGPGLFENLIKEYCIKYKIIDLSLGEKIPPLNNYGAVVILGGPDSANDENEKIISEINLVEKILRSKIPFLGICLGLQILVKAAGGKVIKSPIKEIGFLDPDNNYFNVHLTDEGQKDQLFSGLNSSLKVFHLHGETVELTNAMTLLAVGKFCKNQIVKVGKNAYGIQGHFELTPEMFEIWLNEDDDLRQTNKEILIRTFNEVYDEYERTGKTIFRNFLNIAGYRIY